jgi:hypothetical protein
MILCPEILFLIKLYYNNYVKDFVSSVGEIEAKPDSQSLSEVKQLIERLKPEEMSALADYISTKIEKPDIDFLLFLPIEQLSDGEKQVILNASPLMSVSSVLEDLTPRERLIQQRADEINQLLHDEYARECYGWQPD